MAIDDVTDTVLLSGKLQEAGLSRSSIQRKVSAGELLAVRRGAYTFGPKPDPERSHRQRAIAIALQSQCVAVSHLSGLILHRLPIWNLPLGVVHVMRTKAGRSARTPGVERHQQVSGVSFTRISSVMVVSVADALVQHALCIGIRDDPVPWRIAGDAALFAGMTTQTDLQRALEHHSRRTGIGRARALVPLLEARHESPGETRLAAVLERLGYHSTPQVVVPANGHRYVVDRLLDNAPVALEFDGAVKYRKGTVEDGRRILLAEKKREDDLRSRGLGFVRVDWPMLDTPELLARLIDRALPQTSNRHP